MGLFLKMRIPSLIFLIIKLIKSYCLKILKNTIWCASFAKLINIDPQHYFNDAEYSILWLCYHLANQFPIIGSQIVSRICFYKSLWQRAPRGPGLSLSNLYNTYFMFPTPGMVPGWRSLNTAANIVCLKYTFYYSLHYF